MNIVDICGIVLIVLGGLIGFKKGAVKSIVSLIGMIAITIVAYLFKGVIGSILIKYLPFFNYGGALDGLYAINLLVYQGIAFVIVFVLLYCVLNILIDLSGIVELLLKLTVVLEIPSKIIGAVIGAIESLLFVFVIAFTLLQFGQTQKYILDSSFVRTIVERTPVVTEVFKYTIATSENIYETVKAYQENHDSVNANLEIIRAMISRGLIKAPAVQEAINSGKLHLDGVVVAS